MAGCALPAIFSTDKSGSIDYLHDGDYRNNNVTLEGPVTTHPIRMAAVARGTAAGVPLLSKEIANMVLTVF